MIRIHNVKLPMMLIKINQNVKEYEYFRRKY